MKIINITNIPFCEWMEQMKKVQVEVKRVNILNAPIIKKNNEIERKNIQREKDGLPRLKTIPLKHRLSAWAKVYADREAQVKLSLKSKNPKDWEREVGELLPPARNRVACLVWWDYFGGKKVKNRLPHLDKYINSEYVACPDDDVIQGLYYVGYSPWEATRRATTEQK